MKNRISRCDWLPERAGWSYLTRSGLPAVSRKKNLPESHIINPLLSKRLRLRCLDIGLVFFGSVWTSTPSRSINTQKKKLGQYPAISVTSHLINNPYVIAFSRFCIDLTQAHCHNLRPIFTSKALALSKRLIFLEPLLFVLEMKTYHFENTRKNFCSSVAATAFGYN